MNKKEEYQQNMKFIFPQNYKFETKILGLINYQTAIFNIIWGGIIFTIVNLLFNNLNIKIFLFIIFVFPVLIFSVVGINGDNVIDYRNIYVKIHI